MSEEVQFIDLKSQYLRLEGLINKNIQEVLENGQYILGPSVSTLEESLAKYTGCEFVISVSSGTDALFMPLLGMDLDERDAVFVPSFTYTSTAEAILLAKATPVFVDVDAETFLIDLESLREQIQNAKKLGLRPRVIMPVDLFGQPADYEQINTIALHEGMMVIADAAQAFGAKNQDAFVGNLTHITATSFYPSKPLGCYGDGGAIFTNDETTYHLMQSIRSHGKGSDKYDVVRMGINGRLDTIQAAILLAKLSIFNDELVQREKVAKVYDRNLGDLLNVPRRVPNSRCAWAQYTIRLDKRDMLQLEARKRGIPTMIFYPKPMHLQPAYEKFGLGVGSLPVSERICSEVLSLPMNPYLTDAKLSHVCEVIYSILS